MPGKNKFDKIKMDAFKEAAQKSNETAVVVMVKKIKNENLFDYKYNSEDITDTADLEESIKQLGFTDPIEITDYGMPEGQYTILSGHRRRSAGVKLGIRIFPCLVRNFNSEAEIKNYVLLANSHRDSSKDPLLIAKRYRETKEYLKEQGQTTNFREEIAKRMGLSAKQADRYNRLLDIIPEGWALIQGNIVGMSSILKMSLHSEEEQREILEMLMECNNEGVRLSRDKCENIIEAYKNGIKSYGEFKKQDNVKFNDFSNDETDGDIDDVDDQRELFKNDAEYDSSDKNGGTDNNIINIEDNSSLNSAGNGEVKNAENPKDDIKPAISEIEKRNQRGVNINKIIGALETNFNEFYSFENDETAVLTMKSMQGIINIIIDELENIGAKYNKKEQFINGLTELAEKIKFIL